MASGVPTVAVSNQHTTVAFPLCAVCSVPAVLHCIFRKRQLRPACNLIPGLLVCALIVVWANLIPRVFPAWDPGFSMLLAAMAIVTAVLMPMLLESSVSAAQRYRPALAAGAVWLVTHALVVLFAIIASCMREHGAMDCSGTTEALRQEASDRRERSLDRIKWICVISIGAGFVASVSALLLSSRSASFVELICFAALQLW
jgi:hypothetical protein